MEGDEVAREADGILDRKDVRFSTCVGRRSSRPARRKTALQEQTPTASKPEVTRLEETL